MKIERKLILASMLVMLTVVQPVLAYDWTTETVDNIGDVGKYSSIAYAYRSLGFPGIFEESY